VTLLFYSHGHITLKKPWCVRHRMRAKPHGSYDEDRCSILVSNQNCTIATKATTSPKMPQPSFTVSHHFHLHNFVEIGYRLCTLAMQCKTSKFPSAISSTAGLMETEQQPNQTKPNQTLCSVRSRHKHEKRGKKYQKCGRQLSASVSNGRAFSRS